MFLLVALAASLLALEVLGPSSAGAVGNIEELHDHGRDVDSRAGRVEPTAAQKGAAAELGASVRWNDFGTPQSWTDPEGFLATGVQGRNATVAARDFLAENSEVFGLDAGYMNDAGRLQAVSDTPLTGSSGHAVFFRQRFGELSAVKDGSVTVGLAGNSRSGWKVAYVSSSLTQDVGASISQADATLSAADAWTAAATAIGEDFAGVANAGSEGGFTLLAVDGLAQEQRVRLTALPTPEGGVVPAYEAIFLNDQGGTAEAFTSFVEAGGANAGRVLFRANNVDQLMQTEEPPTTQVFEGAYNANSCDQPAQEGPFTVEAGTNSVVVAVDATNPANDIVIQLLFQGQDDAAVVAEADTVTSPESITYRGTGDSPPQPGDYYVRVCSFENAEPLPPAGYTGFFATNNAEEPGELPYPPEWEYFVSNPPLGDSNGTYPTGPAADNRLVACWNTTRYNDAPPPGCDLDTANDASRAPWDVNVKATGNPPTFTTAGNNARAAESWYSPLTPGPTGYRPASSDRKYSTNTEGGTDYAFTNAWYDSQCSPEQFATPGVGNDISAATASLFTSHNRMHDWSYNLGFTEQAYNLQDNNFGATPADRENDPELGDVQAGAANGGAPSYLGRDNANQITLNDGIAPITNMYLWQPIAGAFYAPCVDGDYDMSVIAHEYGHAIQNRMVAGPDEGLSGLQAGSMGESWADLTAIEYLYEYGYAPGNGANRYAVGPYVTGNKQTGIRNYGMNESPLNYADIEYDPNGVTSPHADGEIWSAANFDIRRLLMNKYADDYPAAPGTDAQTKCADGKRPARTCPGNRRWAQIFHDAFLLQQSSVSFLDARDAYLAADRMRFFGQNQDQLWLAFARRGMGEAAASKGSDDRDPKPSFASPRANNANITFRPVTPGGKAIEDFNVYVGEYEARAVPSATAGDPRELFAPGRYEFVVQAEGFGMRRYQQTFTAGQTGTREITMQPNWASQARQAGPTPTSDGTSGDGGASAQQLLDETEETNWRADGPVEGQQVTVELGGGSHLVDRVNVSAFLRPEDPGDKFGDTDTQSRFSALRGFEILTCQASGPEDCQNPDQGFTSVATEEAGFQASVPRPLAPQLNFQSFDVQDTNATHVQLRVISNQCTGTPAYQGEQDADPLNSTDCDTNSEQGAIVRAAELQVFSR